MEIYWKHCTYKTLFTNNTGSYTCIVSRTALLQL